MQLKAEIEDSRDLILALCKEFLPESQWRLIAQDFQVGFNIQQCIWYKMRIKDYF